MREGTGASLLDRGFGLFNSTVPAPFPFPPPPPPPVPAGLSDLKKAAELSEAASISALSILFLKVLREGDPIIYLMTCFSF